MYDPLAFQWSDVSSYTGNRQKCQGVWTSVDNQLPRINPLTCKDGQYSTIHSTYYHCYLI